MLKYRSGATGEEIELSRGTIKAHVKTAGFYDYEWDVNEIETASGTEVAGFSQKSKIYDLILDFRGNREERAAAAERIFSATSRDIAQKKIGRLYFKQHYIDCYLVSSKYENAERARIVRKTMGVYAPYPMWIEEVERSFPKITGGTSGEYLDHDYDYPHDYTAPNAGDAIWTVDHFAPCEFLMKIYGPCSDPSVVINGHRYRVFITLADGDYMTIDSRENSIVLHKNNGIKLDAYDYREKISGSVFAPITPGNIRVVWPGDFGIDITLFCERSEPRWKTQSS